MQSLRFEGVERQGRCPGYGEYWFGGGHNGVWRCHCRGDWAGDALACWEALASSMGVETFCGSRLCVCVVKYASVQGVEEKSEVFAII